MTHNAAPRLLVIGGNIVCIAYVYSRPNNAVCPFVVLWTTAFGQGNRLVRIALEVACENLSFFVRGKGHLRFVARVRGRREYGLDKSADFRFFHAGFNLFPL